jgi:hypothetical protein
MPLCRRTPLIGAGAIFAAGTAQEPIWRDLVE